MSKIAITGAPILADGMWLDSHAIIIENTQIVAIIPDTEIPAGVALSLLDGGMIVPGFIDTQVNGGGGILFNDHPTVEGISAIAAAHRQFGTTAMLPTLISDDLDVIRAAIAAIDAAIIASVPGIIGIHIEGPFLNAGKHGIHDAKKFRTLDTDAVALLSSLKHGKTLVTLAPELAQTGAIAALVENGVIVSAGHTLATYDDIQRAIAEGLSGITHLFNAMTQMESRAPGVVGAALDSRLFCGIIVDGHHVHPASLRAAYRACGKAGLMLVTDAMPTVGSSSNNFKLGAHTIITDNGSLRSANGTLAGSNLDMAAAVRLCAELMQVDFATACDMASLTPATFLGVSHKIGRIAPGYQADILHLDRQHHVKTSWVAGSQS
jgi:N-acetylglucosamine-6-phosphate deacetylase